MGSEFTFELRDGSGKVLETVNNKNKVITFSTLTLQEEGTYTYKISEKKGQSTDIVYDDTVYTVIVTVTKGESTLIPKITLKKDDATYEGVMVFHNTLVDEGDNPGGDGEGDGDKTDEPVTPDEGGDSEENPEDPEAPTDPTDPENPTEPGDNEGDTDNDTDEELGKPGEEGDATDPVKPPYRKPEVTISNLNPWSYAVDMDLQVKDRSSAISRGIKFAVYSKLKGSGKTTENEEGNKIYPSDSYEGQNLMLRTTRTGTQEMSLNPLKPGATVYIQYSYRYYDETKEMQDVEVIDPETGEVKLDEKGNPVTEQQEVTVRKRVYFYSDFVEVKLPTIEESLAKNDIQPVGMSWVTNFAAYADALALSDVKMENTSAYDAEKAAAAYDFENFKLNTLPYANRLEIELTPENGTETVTLTMGSSVLTRAQKDGAEYQSSSPKLQSNTKYTAKVKLIDRYGNELPLIANQVSSDIYSELIYTQKRKPSVTITEVENVMDSLTLKLKVNDPDHSLPEGENLYFSMMSGEKPAILYGKWKDKSSLGSADATQIALTKAKDGKEYEFTLDSLAFARLFTAQVMGAYSPQPDGVTDPMLEERENELLGRLQVYTASLSNGLIGFNTSFTDVKDTYATMNITMTDDTTVDILPLVDEFRVTLKDKNGNAVRDNSTILQYAALDNTTDYPYDAEKGIILLEEGNLLSPQVTLYGTKDQVRSTPWESFCIAENYNVDEGNNPVVEYTDPMQLQVRFPEKYLTNYTTYTLAIDAVVIKGGEEYYIPVSMTNNKFITKKTIPVITYQDLFIASDIAQFVGLKVLDPDATIQSGGKLTANLYYGKTLLAVKEFYADQTKDSSAEPIDLVFDGLIEDGEYTITFVAEAYNDEDGYGAYRRNYTLVTYDNIRGGSDLTGRLNLISMISEPENGEEVMTAEDGEEFPATLMFGYNVSGYNTRGFTSYYNSWSTLVFPCKPDTMYEICLNYGSKAGLHYGTLSTTMEEIEAVAKAERLSKIIPTTNSSYKSAVGDIVSRITTRQEDNFLLVSFEKRKAQEIKDSLSIREYKPASLTDKFDAEVAVTVSDHKGYLGREGQKSSVTMTLEYTDSMELPDYKPYAVYELPLEAQEEGGLGLDIAKELSGLEPSRGWRATLRAVYQGIEIKLDEIIFRTDANYVSVSTHRELIDAAVANPYANILVTADFDQNVKESFSTYGIIDFQGHVVTRQKDNTSHFITNVYEGGQIRNLVYDYPNENYFLAEGRMILYLRGMVDNLIIRTYGQVEFEKYCQNIYQIYPGGVLRNFVVKLGGDVILNNNSTDYYPSLITGIMYGTVENGYIYGTNGAGLLQMGRERSSLFGSINNNNAQIRNFYSLLDVWQRVDDNGVLYDKNCYLASNSYQSTNSISDVYTVGEFYAMGSDQRKNYRLPLSSPKFFYGTIAEQDNVWCISETENLKPQNVQNVGSVDKLYDLDWHEATLGDAFDVTECVSMGFYPRLLLNTEMQKYQEYLPLPIQVKGSAPSIISDSWADEEEYGKPELDTGYLRLRMKNDTQAEIKEVKIDHLLTTVVNQEMAEDGFYDVILIAQVDPAAAEYVSSYHISGITYTAGAVQRSITVDYDTASIEFWKEVANAEDWHKINNNLKWNYKLTHDIDFTGVAPGRIVINGKLDNYAYVNSTVSRFDGRLDGQEHVLSNISLENITTPWVFYRVGAEAEIKNLLIDSMTITSSPKTTYHMAGFFREITVATVENVHIRNSSVTGGGAIGILASKMIAGAYVEGCSVTDSVLQDMDTGGSMDAGGITGILEGSGAALRHCYTRNVKINVSRSNTTRSVGGLIGYAGTSLIQDCYSHGSISTTSSCVGGIFGQKASSCVQTLRQCIAYVNVMQTSGDYAGGLIGYSISDNHRIFNSIALGDVSGSGENVHRIGFDTAVSESTYAWSGQHAGKLTEQQRGDAEELLTGDELGRASVWQDVIRLGSEWDYTSVKDGYLPLISAKYDCDKPEWRQEPIPLPGQSGDPALQVVNAYYDEYAADGMKYSVTLRLDHPKVAGEQILAYYEDEENPLMIDIDGMDMTAAAQERKEAKIILEPDDDEEFTMIQIKTTKFTKALDGYLLTLTYNDGKKRELSSMISYMEGDEVHINWWEIDTIDKWNYYMPEHGFTEENIMITGMIDFTGDKENVDLRALKFNRLSGKNSSISGFKNLNYAGGPIGSSWVDKVSMEMKGLRFENCTFDFRGVQAEATRARTGPFQSVYNASDLVLEGIKIYGEYHSSSYLAFICSSMGLIEDVTMKNIEVNADYHDNGTSTRSYGAGLVAYSNGNIQGVTAENVIINMPRNRYVGTVLGFAGVWGKFTQDMHATGVKVKGASYVGGLVGYSLGGANQSSITGVSAGNMNKVEAETSYAGGLGGYLGELNSPDNQNEVQVTGMVIKANTERAGGFAGSLSHNIINSAVIKDCKISAGTDLAGGLGGACSNVNSYSGTYNNYRNIQIVDCDIKVEGNYAGGLVGYNQSNAGYTYTDGVVVRNTAIEGTNYVGGLTGWQHRQSNVPGTIDRVYIAEDVTVTGTRDCVGGLIGYSNIYTITNAICGAKVSGASAVGGIIGQIETYNNGIAVTFDKVMYLGEVKASKDYAGGLVGKLNSASAEYTDSTLKNCAVAASVTSAGTKASLWINDTATSGSAGRGTVYICEESVLNGQRAKALYDAAEAVSKQMYVVPETTMSVNLMTPASRFAEEDFYTKDLTLDRNFWEWSHLGEDNVYMPYTKDYVTNKTSKGVLYYANHKNEDAAQMAGILIPKASTFADNAYAVYASGVNTINIEAPDGITSVTVTSGEESKTYTPDANGVITLNYQFDKDFTIDTAGTVTYTGAELDRQVMTYGNYWYYIKDGKIHYGRAIGSVLDMMDVNTVKKPGSAAEDIDNARHLWQGKVLLSDGTIYTLDGEQLSNQTTASASLTQADKVVPFWNDSTVAVYHDFTVTGDAKLPYRVFLLNGTPYTVAPQQDTVHDGVVLAAGGESESAKRYFATLGSDGTINAWLSNMKMNGVANSGIDHISNNLGYGGTVLLICYEDGSVAGVDYVTGTVIFDTTPKTFMAYAARSFKSFFNPGAYGTFLMSVGDYEESETEQQQEEEIFNDLNDSLEEIGIFADGSSEEDGSFEGDGSAAADATATGAGSTVADGTAAGAGSTVADGTAAGAGSTVVDGTASGDGSTVVDGTASGAGSTVVDGTASGAGSTVVDGTASGDGSTAADGTVSGDGSAAVDGTTSGAGSAAAEKDSMETSGQTAGNAAVSLQEILGTSLLVFSPETGSYVAMETNSLAEGTPKTLANLIAKGEAKLNPDQEKPDVFDKNRMDNELDIAHGIGRGLYSEEKQGFVMIGISAAAAIMMLAVIYFAVIKRRNK